MSRLKTKTRHRNDRKQSRIINSKSIRSSQKSSSNFSNSSDSSIPLIESNKINKFDPKSDLRIDENSNEIFGKQTINDENHSAIKNTEFTNRKQYNTYRHSIKRSAWQPVINELLIQSKRPISRASSHRSKCKSSLFKRSRDLKPRHLDIKKRSLLTYCSDKRINLEYQNCCAETNGQNSDQVRQVDNFPNASIDCFVSHADHSKGQLNESNKSNELNSTNRTYDHFIEQLYGRMNRTKNERKDYENYRTKSDCSTVDQSSVDKNLNLSVPNDLESRLYSINAIRDFEVPNFETNKFEKIRVKLIDTGEKYSKINRKCSKIDKHCDEKIGVDLKQRTGYSTEDSNNEIYGLYNSSNRTTNSASEFVDMTSEFDTSMEMCSSSNTGQSDRHRSMIEDTKCRELRSKSESYDRQTFDKMRQFKPKTRYEEEEMEFESTYENRIPEMVISKTIQLNNEFESDYANKSIANELEIDKIRIEELIRSKTNDDLMIRSNETNLKNERNESSRFESSRFESNRFESNNEQSKRKSDKKSDQNAKFNANPVNKLLELFEPNVLEARRQCKLRREESEEERLFDSKRKISFPSISRDHPANELNHYVDSNYRAENCNQSNQSRHNSQYAMSNHANFGKQHTQFTKHNQLNRSNQATNQRISFEQSIFNKQQHDQTIGQSIGQSIGQAIGQSITMSPVQANHLELQREASIDRAETARSPQTNFILHPYSNSNANFAFFKQETETQRHFLVTFKHYYPEKTKWAFILLTCVILIHSLQFVFQIEHLFIIDSSVYFNTSLTLSVFTGALSSCVSLFLSPFVISFCQHNSSRLIAFLGSIMCALGLLFTSFATLPGQLLIAYSLFFSVGSSLLRESSASILSKYFKRRRILVEMIIIFFCYLSYAFLPIILSYTINTRNWRHGLQIYALLFLICFFTCILMRPASLYHPQRRAILHLKSLQKRSKLKKKQQQSNLDSDHLLGSIRLMANRLRDIVHCVDFSPIHSRTIQLLLCSICLISFGIYHPIFVLCPTFYINHNFNLTTLYYLQLTFGLSGCVSPVIVFLLFNRPIGKRFSNNKMFVDCKLANLEKEDTNNTRKLIIKDPLVLIKLSSLAVSILQFYLVRLNIDRQATHGLYIIIGLYAFFYSLLFCSLKILIIRKVRARSVCLLWAWFELFQAIPLLIGTVLSAFLNDTFGNNVGTYFSAICCLIGFVTLFSINIHRHLNRKHIDSYLQNTKDSKLWTIKSTAGKHHSQTDDLLRSTKDETFIGKSLNATVRLLNSGKRFSYSPGNNSADEMMVKFYNCRQEQHPNKHQRIDQTVQRIDLSTPQLSANDRAIKENDFYVLNGQNSIFNAYPVTTDCQANYPFGSRHSLDTLLNKLSNQTANANQLINFASLPEFRNLILRYSDLIRMNFNATPLDYVNSTIPMKRRKSSLVYSAFSPQHFNQNNNFDAEKMIYLKKSDSSFEKRRNSRKLSQPIEEITLMKSDTKSYQKGGDHKDDGSDSSLCDPDSDLEEINLDCNQLKNDKQVLEDLNELINESLNNDNLDELDKYFARCSPSSGDDDLKAQKAGLNRVPSVNGFEKASDDEIKNLSNNKLDLQALKEENYLDNRFSGQLICNDFENLVQTLLQSKQIERHQKDCVMSKLIQEILKQITIKSLSDEFNNQTSSSDSPVNIIQFQSDLSRHFESDRKFDKLSDRFVNRFDDTPSDRSADKFENNFLDPSKICFLRESLLSSKCVNCDKLLID